MISFKINEYNAFYFYDFTNIKKENRKVEEVSNLNRTDDYSFGEKQSCCYSQKKRKGINSYNNF